jgi:hypothetical protein
MDRSPLMNALKLAKDVISTHGIIEYMNENSRNWALNRPVEDANDGIQFDFSLEPKKSPWDPANCGFCLRVNYTTDGVDREILGGVYRNYTRRVKVNYSSGEVTTNNFKQRENMLSSLLLLCEMLEAVLPERIQVTVLTEQEAAEKKKLLLEQKIATDIFNSVGPSSIKNLRKGGKGKIVRIPQTYVEEYGKFPETGDYRFHHVAQYDRRGFEKVTNTYILKVTTCNDSSHVKFFKII